jgi:hypothetical protein
VPSLDRVPIRRTNPPVLARNVPTACARPSNGSPPAQDECVRPVRCVADRDRLMGYASAHRGIQRLDDAVARDDAEAARRRRTTRRHALRPPLLRCSPPARAARPPADQSAFASARARAPTGDPGRRATRARARACARRRREAAEHAARDTLVAAVHHPRVRPQPGHDRRRRRRHLEPRVQLPRLLVRRARDRRRRGSADSRPATCSRTRRSSGQSTSACRSRLTGRRFRTRTARPTSASPSSSSRRRLVP